MPLQYFTPFRLTAREAEVAHLSVHEGKSRKEIARLLFISDEAVKKHRRNILEKCGGFHCGDLPKIDYRAPVPKEKAV